MLADEYLALTKRLDDLRRKRSVLQGREEQKRIERERLEKELQAAGIDTSQPEQEIARLEAEAKKLLAEATEQVDRFEREIRAIWPEENRAEVERKLQSFNQVPPEAFKQEPTANDGSLDLS